MQTQICARLSILRIFSIRVRIHIAHFYHIVKNKAQHSETFYQKNYSLSNKRKNRREIKHSPVGWVLLSVLIKSFDYFLFYLETRVFLFHCLKYILCLFECVLLGRNRAQKFGCILSFDLNTRQSIPTSRT